MKLNKFKFDHMMPTHGVDKVNLTKENKGSERLAMV